MTEAARSFLILCDYDADADAVCITVLAEGGAAPDVAVGYDLSALDGGTVCIVTDVAGFDAQTVSVEKTAYSAVVTLPLPEIHEEFVSVHVYYRTENGAEPNDFAKTVRTSPRKESDA